MLYVENVTLREKCPHGELFCLRTEYGVTRSISPCSFRMRENTDQNNSEYGRFLRSVTCV